MMKKIVFLALLMINGFFLVFAFIKLREANKIEVEAMEFQNEANVRLEEAQRHAELALDAAERATLAKAEANKLQAELAECRGE